MYNIVVGCWLHLKKCILGKEGRDRVCSDLFRQCVAVVFSNRVEKISLFCDIRSVTNISHSIFVCCYGAAAEVKRK